MTTPPETLPYDPPLAPLELQLLGENDRNNTRIRELMDIVPIAHRVELALKLSTDIRAAKDAALADPAPSPTTAVMDIVILELALSKLRELAIEQRWYKEATR